jgi:hypothetical protein
MATITAPDLTQSPPRSGRKMLGPFSWLGRLADKVRAKHAKKEGEYIAYCPISVTFLERCGVNQDAFDELINQGASDEQLVAYFERHVTVAQRDRANSYVLNEQAAQLNELDREEGRL